MLTKKEKELVDSRKAIIEKPEPEATKETYRVFMSLTKGELLAMKYALENHPTPVGQDVHAYVNNACDRAGIEF